MLPNSSQPRYLINSNQQSKELYNAFYHSSNDPNPSSYLSSLHKNRNLSLNDLKPSSESHLRNSILQNSLQQSEQGGREIKKLRMRIQELEKENKSLYNLNIQFEEQAKIWQEKARSLNDQLISYQNIELQHSTTNAYETTLNQELLQNEEIRELKKLVIILEETNNENIKRVETLSSQLEIHKRQNAKMSDLKESHRLLNIYCEQIEKKLQRKIIEHKQSISDLQKMEEELEQMGKEIPNKISILQNQNLQINKREKQQLQELIRSLEVNLSDIQKRFRLQTDEKEILQNQNSQLRKELQSEKERIYKYQNLNQEQQRQNQQSIYLKLREREAEIITVNHQLSCLSQRNHTIEEDLFSKNRQIKELTSKNTFLQNQSKALAAQISKYKEMNASSSNNFETDNTTISLRRDLNNYKQQIQRLKKTNQEQIIKIEQKYQRIQMERQQEKRSLKQQVDNLQGHIKKVQVNHSYQKFELVQSVDMDTKEFGKMAKQQQIETAAIHKKYCYEIDKLMEENLALKNKMRATQNKFHSQFQQMNRQLKKSEDSSRLQMERQKLELRLKEQEKITAELHERLLASEQKYQQTSMIAKQLTQKIKDYQVKIEQFCQQNQKWRSYRRSEEQDARMESRRYKKFVEELQMKLKDVQQLESYRKTCDQLRIAKAEQQQHYQKLLLQETKRFTNSIDEMEVEMRKILRECQNKISEKQLQIDELSQQYKEISEKYRYSALEFQISISGLHQAQQENDKLKNQNAMSRSQISRLQALLKKLDADNQSLRYSSEAQKDFIKTRYDKDMEDKVTEIQRLKLQVAQLSEQLKKNTISKKQVEVIQMTLRNKQMEIKESQQRHNYLEEMIRTYQGQIKSFKTLRDKDAIEKRNIEENMIILQRKASQLENDNLEIEKTNKLNEQKYREWKYQSQQLQFESQQLQGKLNKFQIQERQTNKIIKDQQDKIHQLSSELNRLSRVNDERQKDQQKIRNLKSMVQQSRNIEQNFRKCQVQLQDLKEKYEKQVALARILQIQANQYRKQKKTGNDQLQGKYKSIIEQQRSKIKELTADQTSKLQQIQILLSKIAFLEGEAITKSSKASQNAQTDINKRIGWYLKMCALNLVGNMKTKLSYDGNEELFLAILYETLKVLSDILSETMQELNVQKKEILELAAERDSFYNKYIKYKSIATDYKERKEVQRQVLKNSYRFNEQIINHCQGILKERK